MEVVTSNGIIKRDFYITKKGQRYDINEIAYTRTNIFRNLGTFIEETSGLFFDYGDKVEDAISGVYIYQDNIDKKVGYRIYRELYDYGFNGYKDDELIYNLKQRSKNIKLTQFPYGVITLDGNIIGQEMPFYQNCITVKQFCNNNDDKRLKPTDIYLAIINIIKELYDNGIYYYDIHANNFLILYDELEKNPKNISKIIKLIDFDDVFIDFDFITESDKKRLFDKLCTLINLANKRFGLSEQVGKMICIKDFDDAYEQIEVMKRKIEC